MYTKSKAIQDSLFQKANTRAIAFILILLVCFFTIEEHTIAICIDDDSANLNFGSSYAADAGGQIDARANIDLRFSGFMQNVGQLNDNSIYYYTQGFDFIAFKKSAVYLLMQTAEGRKSSLLVSFSGAESVMPSGIQEMDHHTNVFRGQQQYTNIPSFAEIWYNDLYPDIDLRFYVTESGLKYDFIVKPGGNPEEITLSLSGLATLMIEESEISIVTEKSVSGIWETGLYVYQEGGHQLDASFTTRTEPNHYGFDLGEYDASRRLIVDPVWPLFSTFLGGGARDDVLAITQDDLGNIFVAGRTESRDFPTQNPYDDTYQAYYDIFISKFNSTGTGLIYSTYISGEFSDEVYGIEVDGEGNCFIGGRAASSDFPLYNAYQTTLRGYTDAFVLKLNSTGNGIVFSTFIGGGHWDRTYAFTIDHEGNSYVAGYTYSDNFPTKNAVQSSLLGTTAPFVAKLNSTGNGLIFGTYLGGSAYDAGTAYSIAVDASGNCYVTGDTESDNFQIVNALQPSRGGGEDDGFFVKFNEMGTLLYSSYLGGSSYDQPRAVAVDPSENVYISGYTYSSDFPTENSLYDEKIGSTDAFITKINSTGNGLIYSTYFGGTDTEEVYDISLDSSLGVCISGHTSSSDFPLVEAFQHSGKIFVTQLDSSGSGIIYSTFIAEETDILGGIHIDNDDGCVAAGTTLSADYITKSAFQDELLGSRDGFILKIDRQLDEQAPLIDFQNIVNNSVYKSGQRIEIVPIDDLSEVMQVQYSWDGSGFSVLQRPYELNLIPNDIEHILMVRAEDYARNSGNLTLMITTDDTGPSIISPGDLLLSVSENELPAVANIQWTLQDMHPNMYEVYRDGVVIESGTWGSDLPITLTASLHTEGIYNFTILANDTAGNQVSDTIHVTVELPNGPFGLPLDMTQILILGVTAVAGVVLVLVVAKTRPRNA
ncbi:MAG: SBBP repeat-containing protein [Promethearchaeota archaeon]